MPISYSKDFENRIIKYYVYIYTLKICFNKCDSNTHKFNIYYIEKEKKKKVVKKIMKLEWLNDNVIMGYYL